MTNTCKCFCHHRSFGLLLIRIAIGSLFFMHGLSKVGDMARTVAMFAHMGFPAFIAYFIAWLEVIGGAGLILGILTSVFGILFGIEMLVAVFLGGLARAFGGIELLLSLASFGIACAGSGKYSIFAGRCPCCKNPGMTNDTHHTHE